MPVGVADLQQVSGLVFARRHRVVKRTSFPCKLAQSATMHAIAIREHHGGQPFRFSGVKSASIQSPGHTVCPSPPESIQP